MYSPNVLLTQTHMPHGYKKKPLLPTLLVVARTSAHGKDRITAFSSSTHTRRNSACTAHLQAPGFQPLQIPAEMKSAEQEGCRAGLARQSKLGP